MEENKIEIIKPEFNGEIQAKIKSVGEIESNMKEVKAFVENLKEYYLNIIFTEETLPQAKEEKAKINKLKKQVADYRKNIIGEYNKPIKLFEDTAKETERILTETYETINNQVNAYTEKQRQEKENELRLYFEEYQKEKNIDFIKYEGAKVNVTVSASMKSLKEQVKNFIDRISDDLSLINTQEHKAEILVEYKQTLNVSNAITTVVNRFKAIEEERKKQEQIMEKRIEEEKQDVREVIRPFQEVKEQEMLKTYTITFKVTDNAIRLKQLKDYLVREGYQYE